MDMPPDAYFEPWTPKIGDRVRVRLSGECQYSVRLGTSGPAIQGHSAGEDGVTGTVIEWPLAAWMRVGQGHDFAVEYDGPIESEGLTMRGAEYAACELEPLDGDS